MLKFIRIQIRDFTSGFKEGFNNTYYDNLNKKTNNEESS